MSDFDREAPPCRSCYFEAPLSRFLKEMDERRPRKPKGQKSVCFPQDKVAPERNAVDALQTTAVGQSLVGKNTTVLAHRRDRPH